MSNILRGAATRLTINGSNITGEKTFAVNMSLNTHDYASFTDLQFENKSPRLYGWTASAGGLLTVAVAGQLANLALAAEPEFPVSFKFGDYTYSGRAIVTDLQMSGGHKGAAKWSLKLKGTGSLSV